MLATMVALVQYGYMWRTSPNHLATPTTAEGVISSFKVLNDQDAVGGGLMQQYKSGSITHGAGFSNKEMVDQGQRPLPQPAKPQDKPNVQSAKPQDQPKVQPAKLQDQPKVQPVKQDQPKVQPAKPQDEPNVQPHKSTGQQKNQTLPQNAERLSKFKIRLVRMSIL
jgi:hypothetical protein